MLKLVVCGTAQPGKLECFKQLWRERLQNRGVPRAGHSGDEWPTINNSSFLCDPAHQDTCSCFELSGAGRWPGARGYTNKRKQNVLFHSAVSSTPEFAGQKVWIHLATSAPSQDGESASGSRTPGCIQGRSRIPVSNPPSERISLLWCPEYCRDSSAPHDGVSKAVLLGTYDHHSRVDHNPRRRRGLPAGKAHLDRSGNWPVHLHPDVFVALELQHSPFPFPRPDNCPEQPSPAAIKRYGTSHLPIQLVLLPKYASWLNLIKKLWRKLRQDVLHLHRQADDLTGLRERVLINLSMCITGWG